MADFSTTDLKRETVPANAAPVAPVQKGPNPFASLIGTVAKEGIDFLESSSGNSVIAGYNRELDKINQRLEQGAITSTQANAQVRSLSSRTLAANPKMTKEISQSHNAFKGITSIGESFEEEERFEEIEQAQAKEASLAGWIPEGATVDEVRRSTSAYLEDKRLDEELNQLLKDREFEMSQEKHGMTVSTFRRENQERVRKERTQQILDQKVMTNFSRFQTTFNAALRGVNKSDPQSVQALSLAIDNELSALRAEANRFAGIVPNAEITQKLKPFEDLATSYKSALLDETAAKGLENQIALIERGAIFNLYNKDPLMAQLNATTEIFKAVPGLADIVINSPTVNNMFKSIFYDDQPPANPLAGTPSERTESFKNLRTLLNSANEEDKDQAVNGINRMLDGFSAYDQFKQSPEDYAQVASFVASPEFGKLVNEGKITPEAAFNAGSVIQREYETEVVKATQRNIQATFRTIGGKDFDMNDLLEVSFAGNNVVARRTDQLLNVRDRGTVDMRVSQLQPALNAISQMVRINAHLNGSIDYKAEWESSKHVFFPQLFTAPQRENTDQGISTQEDAEIDAQIASGEATQVTIEDIEGLSDEQLQNLINSMTGSQRTRLLQAAGFEG